MAKDRGKSTVPDKPITSRKAKPAKKVVRKPKIKPSPVKNYDQDFEYICIEVENGNPLRRSCLAFMSTKKFYELLDESEEKRKRYARACEERAEKMFDDILEIADESNADLAVCDGKLIVDGEAIQRSKLKIEARKWMLAKMQPKKYGDKIDIDHTSKGESIAPTPIVFTKGSNG